MHSSEINEFNKNKSSYKVFQKQLENLEKTNINHSLKNKHPNKLKVRERIELLLDNTNSWLEIGKFAGHDLYTIPTPCAGIVCGIGLVSGSWCMIIANDFTVKAGCYFPITVKKHIRALKLAHKLKLPCVYLVDSAGIYLPMQEDSFADASGFGRIFYLQAQLLKEKIPQIAIVLGSCVAGGAYIPAMSDDTIMVKKQSSIFLAGPALVKAATNEETNTQDLGGCEIHSTISGVADYVMESETQAILLGKKLIAQKSNSQTFNLKPIIQENIYGYIPSNPKMPVDIKNIINTIVDKDSLIEYKEKYAKTIITTYAKINNIQVGIIANNGILFSDSAKKAEQFIKNIENRKMPLIFLQNITGFMVGRQSEASGIIKYGAKLVQAVSLAKTPKITIIINNSYGAGNYAMCGRAFDPDFLFTWPSANTAVMGSFQLDGVLTQITGKPTSSKYNSSAIFGSKRLWDDGIIDPALTRNILAHSLSILTATRRINEPY